MDPINYSLQVSDPFKSALQGYQGGMAIRQDQQEQQALIAQQQQAKQQQSILQELMRNPTAQNYANAALAVPGYKDQIKQSWETRSGDQQQTDLRDLGQVYAAIANKQPQFAADILEMKATALENSGGDKQQIGMLRAMASAAKDHPDFVAGQTLAALQSVSGGDKVLASIKSMDENRRAQELQPATVAEAQSKATTAGVTAANAGDRAVLENEKLATDISVARDNSRIKAMEVSLSKETNDLKRHELQLKIEDARAARDEKLRTKASDADTAIADVDSTIGILGEILGDEDTLRAAVGTGAWRGAIPGTKARTMAGKIEQLQNAIASTNLDKLKGAMSDKDIMFLKNIATNLDRYQDEDKFIAELTRVAGSLESARERVIQKFGAAGTPAAEGATVIENHPKYGKVTERRLRQLATKAGVSVKEARQFLENSQPASGASGGY